MNRRTASLLMFVAIGVASSSSLSLADDAQTPAPPAAAATEPPRSLFRWIYDAEGIFFFPQLTLSIALVAVIAANVAASLPDNFLARPFAAQFDAMVKNKQFKEAYELAKRDSSLLGRLLTAGIGRLSDGYGEATVAVQEVAEQENMRFEHRLSYLAMLANVATMVGLLGTVWGMVASFMVISRSDISPKPSELAHGVSQALVTTIFGLMQAIPAVAAFTILRNLVGKRMMDVAVAVDQMLRPFRALQVSRKTEAKDRPATAEGPFG